MVFITDLHLALRLRMSIAILLPPLSLNSMSQGEFLLPIYWKIN